MIPYVSPRWLPESWALPGSIPTDTVDVVVVGGGLSGCAAAVAAARCGVRVVLIEPLHMLGGQMTVSAVGFTDWFENASNTVTFGFWNEIMGRCSSIYAREMDAKSTDVAYYSPGFATSALVGDRALTELCLEAGVEVIRNCPVPASISVSTSNAVLSDGSNRLTCAVVVDATEDGVVLQRAGVKRRLGNKVFSGTANESRVAIQDMTFPLVIRKYPHEVPAGLRFTAPPPGYDGIKDGIASFFPLSPWKDTTARKGFAGYRALPDLASSVNYTANWDSSRVTRTALNFINDVPIDSRYLTDENYRLGNDRWSLNRGLSILYYLQHDLGLPWAIADDEGFDEGPPNDYRARLVAGYPDFVKHIPVRSYLRESRRLVGKFTMTWNTVGRTGTSAARWDQRSIGIGMYMNDLHGTQQPENLEAELGEPPVGGIDIPLSFPCYPIVSESLFADNDLRLIAAEKNISMSRLISGSVRVHPTVTAVGQAAGVVAAGVVKKRCAPRAVPLDAIQYTLLVQRALLLPRPFSAGPEVGSPDWIHLSLGLVRQNPNQFFSGTGANQVLSIPSGAASSLSREGASITARAKGVIV